MRDLQARHKEWTDRNFGNREPKTNTRSLDLVLPFASCVGRMAHHVLKAHQGIRGSKGEHEVKFDDVVEFATNELIHMVEESVVFGEPSKYTHLDTQCLLGVIEEVGELTGAHLEGRHEDQIDAVGDITLYLIDYCNKAGIDFEDAVRTTAEKVHARDWVSNPVNGEVWE